MPYKYSWGEKAKLRAKKRKNYFSLYQKNRDPLKINARKTVYLKLRKGEIEKSICQNCKSNEKIQAHHEDYNKPLDIIWLCSKCHYKLHYIPKQCSVKDCQNKHSAKGMCNKHYLVFWKSNTSMKVSRRHG